MVSLFCQVPRDHKRAGPSQREKPAKEMGASARIGNRNYPGKTGRCKGTVWKGKGTGEAGTEPGNTETPTAQDLQEPIRG